MRLTLFVLFCVVSKNAFAKQPNILFIIIDDLKPAIRSFGYKNAYTPNIDALAEKSFLFTKAFAQQALCAPSRNSLLTSRRPDTLHLYDFYNYWRATVGNFTTLPQYFKESGYYTYSVGKVFHPGISSNFTDDCPYSWSAKPFHPKTEVYENSKVCIDKDGSLAQNLLCPVIVDLQPKETLPDLETLNESLYFLRNKNKITTKPFFLAVGFHKPHIPFRFPLQYLDYHPLKNITLPSNRWRPSLLPDVAWNPWTDIREREDIKKINVPFPYGPLPDETIREIIQAYNAATSYIDDLVGKLLNEVDKNTIIVLTSDHGWSLGQHGEFAKYSNFEEATRVPLLIRVPHLTEKKIVCDNLVELVDIFPTLVDLTQVAQPLKVCSNDTSIVCTEGLSLVPIMIKNIQNKISTKKSAVFTQYPRPGIHPSVEPNSDKPHLKDIKIMGYSIKTQRYRYTEWIRFFPNNFTVDWSNTYGKELYDHFIDPEENMNLVNRNELSTTVKRLRIKLILGWRHAYD
ncbi:iduronate 2-sulfatase [Anoplophora glabripennis]|uniref:iduronate 2-sulfatase n=1 Tax=Anoplophora glabripennis TaxID=217634 RepID=UPI0008750D88|nr:iduronate 2-sulfatase [Anoplophora glabripennis]